jgi:hypothetical protein
MAGWTWSGTGYPSPSQVQPAQNARQKQLSDAAKQASINNYKKDIESFD